MSKKLKKGEVITNNDVMTVSDFDIIMESMLGLAADLLVDLVSYRKYHMPKKAKKSKK